MSLITRCQRQKAVYWGPLGRDEYGTRTHQTGVELTCRWSSETELVVLQDGSTYKPKHTIITQFLLSVGGLLWLGSLSDWDGEDPPKESSTVFVVRSVSATLNIRATKALYEAMV